MKDKDKLIQGLQKKSRMLGILSGISSRHNEKIKGKNLKYTELYSKSKKFGNYIVEVYDGIIEMFWDRKSIW